MRGALSWAAPLEGGGSKSGPAMAGVPLNNRVVVKRDPPKHGFGLWPGSGKVAGKVLILDLSDGPAKLLILLYSVLVWLRARASNRSLAAPVFPAGLMGFPDFPWSRHIVQILPRV
jgi:hypothetical protein